MKNELIEKIDSAIEKEALRSNCMGSETVTVNIQLSKIERENFLSVSKYENDNYSWDFEDDTLIISYTEDNKAKESNTYIYTVLEDTPYAPDKIFSTTNKNKALKILSEMEEGKMFTCIDGKYSNKVLGTEDFLLKLQKEKKLVLPLPDWTKLANLTVRSESLFCDDFEFLVSVESLCRNGHMYVGITDYENRKKVVFYLERQDFLEFLTNKEYIETTINNDNYNVVIEDSDIPYERGHIIFK